MEPVWIIHHWIDSFGCFDAKASEGGGGYRGEERRETRERKIRKVCVSGRRAERGPLKYNSTLAREEEERKERAVGGGGGGEAYVRIQAPTHPRHRLSK